MTAHWTSLLPPLIAIGLSLAFRQVVLALFAGVWAGATLLDHGNVVTALLSTLDKYVAGALADADHAQILVFTLLLGGMLGVLGRSGGAQGFAALMTRHATSPRRGQLATWGLGILIFFDDYANALLVGTTMRPITDRLRISREKLAFIVDATAAPVASVALVSSWIGVEVGYIADQVEALHIDADPYVLFLESISYRFYPILMLVFGLVLIWLRRDFGQMLRAERRARVEGRVFRDGANLAADAEALGQAEGVRPRWINAAAPILAVVAVTLAGMYVTGKNALLAERAELEAQIAEAESTPAGPEKAVVSPDTGDDPAAALVHARHKLARLSVNIRNIFGKASSLQVLLWAAMAGCLVAMGLALGQRALTLSQTLDAWTEGLKSMVPASLILVLAWAIGAVCRDVMTAQFLIQAVGGWLSPELLPAVVFLVGAAIAFATGTSWGTMAILFPLVMPLANELAPGSHHILLGAVSSILSGAVWGDHCSPISDTTILSSLGSSCDHVDHVRTQLPYALVVGAVAVVIGDLGTGLGLYPGWVGLLLGSAVLILVVRLLGRPVAAERA